MVSETVSVTTTLRSTVNGGGSSSSRSNIRDMICQASRIDKTPAMPRTRRRRRIRRLRCIDMAREVRACVAVRRYDGLGGGDRDPFDRIHDFCCR